MTSTYKVLGQSAPSATTNTDLYTVPALTSAVNSAIVVCNRSATPTTFRIAVRPGGATIANQHYVAYDVAINGNDITELAFGIGLATTDVVTVYAGAATLSFGLFGVELT